MWVGTAAKPETNSEGQHLPLEESLGAQVFPLAVLIPAVLRTLCTAY